MKIPGIDSIVQQMEGLAEAQAELFTKLDRIGDLLEELVDLEKGATYR